jgi:hypothetical protein
MLANPPPSFLHFNEIAEFNQYGRAELPSLSSSLSLSLTSTPSTAGIIEFSPILNIPALTSFLLIVIIFSALQFRIHQIENAVRERSRALQRLKQLKVQQLVSGGGGGGVSSNIGPHTHDNDDIDDHQRLINDAMANYRHWYQRADQLRAIIPGGWIRIAMSPSSVTTTNQQNDYAAHRYLGVSLNNDDIMTDNSQKQTSQQLSNTTSGLSMPLKVLLGVVAMTQVLLLFMLVLDPTVTNELFIDIVGKNSM